MNIFLKGINFLVEFLVMPYEKKKTKKKKKKKSKKKRYYN
tara:strand:- start:105 stop:224 length:120 start_codon:yes stop_codon:yes gene_type:complete